MNRHLVLGGTLLFGLLGGCGPAPAPDGGTSTPVTAAPAQDHFSIAMNLFGRIDEFDFVQGRRQVFDNLNRWAEDQPRDEAWQPDPLVAKIPSPWRELPPLRNLNKVEFAPDDIDYLIEASWARDIARWVSAAPLDPFLAGFLPADEEGLSKADVERLGVALRLFDWTIRNVQLDELLPMPKSAVAGPAADPGSAQKPALPQFQGVPGPGYRRFPWQTLLMGHGDAWERARVFILLCRQEGIDVVMLGTIEGAPTSPPKPWIPAVLLKDRLYLLDTGLGLPIPGPDGKSIATLSQLVTEPKLLRKLDADADHPYPMTAEALTQVVAMIDAPHAALSRRMALAESRLTGGDRMTLTVAPSEIKSRLAKLPGISGVQLWSMPYETLVYRAAYAQVVGQNPETLRVFYRDEGPFQATSPIVLARHQHFRGIFDTSDQRDRDNSAEDNSEDSGREQPGARTYYLAARTPDEEIRKFETSEEMQRALGLVKGEREPVEAWNERRRAIVDGMKNIRHNAAFWLGITHYERQSYKTAIDWFQKRTLDAAPEALCANGARYNLARAHEALQDFSTARVIYLTDESPQQHGNRLRAAWID